MPTLTAGSSRRISQGVILRSRLNLAPEFLVPRTETACGLIPVKMTGQPEPAAIEENPHRWMRHAHRTAANRSHCLLQRRIIDISLVENFVSAKFSAPRQRCRIDPRLRPQT